MLAAFLNPFTIIAGSALVLTPIIIHLINRIRFRRVKWAAMEFLLKAQKRMRRRKILEQLLLLLLRCILVFLVGALFARYIGGCGSGPQETRPTTHVVILDDTPSMAEISRRGDGAPTTAFDEAKRLVYEKLMPAAAEATTGQTLHLVRLSDLENPFPTGTKWVDGKEVARNADEVREEARVQAKSIVAMGDYLKPLQPAVVRRSLVDGIKKARKVLEERTGANNAQVLHIISDLRASDWAADGPAIYTQLKELKDEGVAVHLIDVAHPARKPDRKTPDFGDNVSIVEFKPRNRVVSANQKTEIELRVRNNGKTDLKDVGVSFYLNGQGNIIASAQIPNIPANQEETQSVTVTFTQTGTKDKPLDRFNLVTAVIQEANGLAIDNARHTIVEVRDALKVLVVDGRTVENGIDLRDKPEGDSLYLRKLFQTKADDLGNLEVESAEFSKLDKIDLRPFSTVYFMNVPTLSEAAAANVERFVREGGGVGFFLGPDVKADEYNARLYKGSTGFFPVQLQSAPSPELTLEQKLARELAFGKRLLLREPGNRFHAALKRIYTNDRGELVKDDGVEKFFLFANIDVHWPVRRSEWRDDPRVKELYCLPNEATNGTFDQRADTLVSEIKKRWNEPKFEAARKYLGPLMDNVRKSVVSTEPLSVLARYLDQVLCDQINDGHESEPVLREFWNQPEMAETKKLASELRDAVKYGDPLYVVKRYGFGRVAVITTDAGGTYTGKKQWSDWPSGKGAPGWTVVVAEMQKYLSGGGDDSNRAVGSEFIAEFDATRYEPVVSASLLTSSDPTRPSTDRKLTLERKDLGKVTLDAPAPPAGTPPDAPPPPFKLKFSDTKVPGAYLFTLTRKKAEGPIGAPDPLGTSDFVGAAFNVDALNEGDLRRANTDDVAGQTGKVPLHNAEDLGWIDDLKQKPSDLSSGRWLYLLILLVLVAEQAWAVRTSYHSRPEDLEALAPSAAAAYTHHTPPTPVAGEPAP
ncbi:BatA domain-containing protein [Frigoriglobus tundricola]|uniref:Aerotolerance regulator N-terminal domain-containing protein n=1 Tax=Frigoriglobus tundricola TaxID=2774151 RepID=A0A6M5YJQ1_9BACT|nr:BatA domain-containing protein [Frigoriglobus tundricola]QJW93531.1 hypothetical protein FTUN_1038 [Frigoriglobus tundricola]